MNVTDSLLLSYVSDTLPTESREKLEAMMQRDSALQHQVESMLASNLPYQAAFSKQPLPELPAQLQNQILDLVRVSSAVPTESAARSGWKHWEILGGLAASFVLGIGLHFGIVTYQNHSGVGNWVADAASYQSLYVRDTVQNIKTDPIASVATLKNIYDREHVHIEIPDMNKVGMQFKRIQRLGFNGELLVQMVYLPESGNPVALCVMAENGPDSEPHVAQYKNMNAVTWRHAGLGYALLADTSRADLPKIGDMLYRQNFPKMFVEQSDAAGS